MLIRHEAVPKFLSSIMWSNAATFKMNGLVDRWNCVYWKDGNSHKIMTQELNLREVTCWASTYSGCITGPCFFNSAVTALCYCKIEEAVISELKYVPHFAEKYVIFQDDYALPHWSLDVCRLLNEEFPD